MAKRRVGIILFLFCLCLCLTPFDAFAVSTADAVEPISPGQTCSLTVSYCSDGTAFSGVAVNVYKVADVSADCRYTLTSAFAASGLVLNGIQSGIEWNVIRATLEAFLLVNDITATCSAETNQSGQVSFDTLEPGLYLALSERVVQEGASYTFGSALIALPGLGADGRWQYQLTVAAKSEVTPLPGPGETPDGGKQYEVLALWKGDDAQAHRPQSVDVEIFRNGSLYQTVSLSEENHWSFSWTAPEDGADWMVAEPKVPNGYALTIEKHGTTFVLIHTSILEDEPGSEPSSPDSPQTGDSTNIPLYTVLMYISGIVLILLGLTGKRSRT